MSDHTNDSGHSGAGRNPGLFKLDPGFRRGDDADGDIVLVAAIAGQQILIALDQEPGR